MGRRGTGWSNSEVVWGSRGWMRKIVDTITTLPSYDQTHTAVLTHHSICMREATTLVPAIEDNN